MPRAPEAPSYAAPLVDFSNIGDLGNQYFKGQVQNKQLQQLNAFKNGMPDPNTSEGIRAIAQEMARTGGIEGAVKAIPLVQGQRLDEAYMRPPPNFEEDQPQTQQPQRRQPVEVTPYGMPVQQATEGMISAVPDSGPNAGRNIAPEINAAGAAATPTQMAQAEPPPPTPSTLPPNVSDKAAKNLDRAAQFYADRASIAERRFGKGAGGGDKEKSAQFAARAAKMREQIAEHGPTAMERKRQELLDKTQIDRGEKLNVAYQGGAGTYMESQKPYNDLARTILSTPGMRSGIGGDWTLVVNRAKDLVGMENAAALQEALQKVTASSVLAQINNQRIELGEAGQTSSRIFSSQVDQVTKASPSLGTTLGGNRYLVNVSDRMGEFKIALAQEAQKYRAEHGYLDKGWDKHVADYLDKHPVFTKEERSNPRMLMAPTIPPELLNEKGIPADPAKLNEWGKGVGLKKGDSVMLPKSSPLQVTVYKHWQQ